MKITNFSGGHEFKFFAKNQCTLDAKSKKWLLKEGEQPVLIVAAPSQMLRANATSTPTSTANIGGFEVPIETFKVQGCDALPTLVEGEIGVVSIMYAQAAKAQGWDMTNFFTITPCYPTADGFPCGVVALNVI